MLVVEMGRLDWARSPLVMVWLHLVSELIIPDIVVVNLQQGRINILLAINLILVLQDQNKLSPSQRSKFEHMELCAQATPPLQAPPASNQILRLSAAVVSNENYCIRWWSVIN